MICDDYVTPKLYTNLIISNVIDKKIMKKNRLSSRLASRDIDISSIKFMSVN